MTPDFDPTLEAGCLAVSVVTVTWNSASVVDRFVTSLEQTLPAGAWELIVVDNHSSDATVERVRILAPGARVIANATNRGLAAANNQGLAEARAPAVLICNPDVIFEPGAVRELLGVLDRRPEAGWVVPCMFHEDGTPQTSAGRLPTLTDALLGRTVARWRSRGGTDGFWWDGWAHDEEQRIERGQEAAYLVRRVAVEEVGFQDERFVLDWEGPDWTDRFRRAGWEVWLAPEARIVHLGGVSVRQVPMRWIFSTHRGMYYYFSDRSPKGSKPGLAVAFAVRGAVKAVAVIAGLPLYQWAHRGSADSDKGKRHPPSGPPS